MSDAYSVSRAASGATSIVSRAPPARVTSCWTLSSASVRSFARCSWSAVPRSNRARARSSGSPPVSSSATVRWNVARASSNESSPSGVSVVALALSVGSVNGLLGVRVHAIERPPDPWRDHDTEPEADREASACDEHDHDDSAKHVGQALLPRRRRKLTAGDSDTEARSGRHLRGVANDRLVCGSPDDRVAALEGGLRSEDGK